MSDELVKRLRGWRGFHQANLSIEAADRIEQLTGEVQRWQGMFDEKHNLMLEHKSRAEKAEAENARLALAICGGEDAPGYANAQTVGTLEHVAKQNRQSHGATINSLLAAEAERDRYRKALEDIIADCEADYPPSHGAIKYAAKLALKGEKA